MTLNGENFYPDFPPLATANPTNQSHGGYFQPPVATPRGMALYTEILTLGIAAEAITHLLSDSAPGPWPPPVAENQFNLPAERNLLKYAPKLKHKAEFTNKLLEIGISSAIFPESIEGTGLFIPLLDQVSSFLNETTIFKEISEPIFKYEDKGSKAELILSTPEDFAPAEMPYVDGNFIGRSLSKDDSQTFGKAGTFLVRVIKEPRLGPVPAGQRYARSRSLSPAPVLPAHPQGPEAQEQDQEPPQDQQQLEQPLALIVYLDEWEDHSTWTALRYTFQHRCPRQRYALDQLIKARPHHSLRPHSAVDSALDF